MQLHNETDGDYIPELVDVLTIIIRPTFQLQYPIGYRLLSQTAVYLSDVCLYIIATLELYTCPIAMPPSRHVGP